MLARLNVDAEANHSVVGRVRRLTFNAVVGGSRSGEVVPPEAGGAPRDFKTDVD